LKSSAEAKPADSGFGVLLLVGGVFLVEPIELLGLCSRDRCGLAHADSLIKTGLERSWLAAPRTLAMKMPLQVSGGFALSVKYHCVKV